jgi:hypothetical protein
MELDHLHLALSPDERPRGRHTSQLRLAPPRCLEALPVVGVEPQGIGEEPNRIRVGLASLAALESRDATPAEPCPLSQLLLGQPSIRAITSQQNTKPTTRHGGHHFSR